MYAIAGVVAYPRRARALRAAALVPAQPGLAFPSLLLRADRTCGNSAHARNRVGIICAWPHQDVQILRRAAHVQVCAYTFKVCLFAPNHDRDLKLSKSHRVVAQARELVWRVLARYARTRNLEKMIIISFGATWLSRKASQGGRPVARVVSDGGATARNAGAEKAVGRGVHGLGKRAALAPETRMSVVAVIRRRTVSARQRRLRRDTLNQTNEGNGEEHLSDEALASVHFDWPRLMCMVQRAYKRVYATGCFLAARAFFSEIVSRFVQHSSARRAPTLPSPRPAAPRASTSSRAAYAPEARSRWVSRSPNSNSASPAPFSTPHLASSRAVPWRRSARDFPPLPSLGFLH